MKKIGILILTVSFIPHFISALTYECSREHKIKTGIFSTQTVAFNKCQEHEIACMCSCNSDQILKEKFKKIWDQHQLRGTPQHQALKNAGKIERTDSREKVIEALEARKKEEEIKDAAVKIHNFLAYCSSTQKIKSFLAATNVNINEDIFKNGEINWNIKKILDILTHSVIGEQCVYVNLPVNLAVIKFCLEKGAIPNTQFVLARKDEFEKNIQSIKKDTAEKPWVINLRKNSSQALKENEQMKNAADKILELYKKHTNNKN